MNSSTDTCAGIINFSTLNKFNHLVNFTTTRLGGYSTKENYSSFNMSKSSGDDLQSVLANREILCNHLAISANQLIIPLQTHSSSTQLIDSNFLSFDENQQNELLKGKDALITNIPTICIAVSTADCVPILIYDPINKAVAAIHAGWKGTCSKIVANTIQLMQVSFGTNPKDLFTVIAPSISPNKYEVGYELIDNFSENGFDAEKIFFEKEGKLYLDLWQANKEVLIENGVQEPNIEVSGICTYTESEKFFSARKLGIKSGRQLSGIMLK